MKEKSAQQENFERSAKVDRKVVYRGRTIALRCDTLEKEGASKTWDIIVHPGAVVLVPVTKKKEIIFVKQWRRAIEKRVIELPAGTLEAGEAPKLCAQRELREETGFRSEKILPLGGFYSAPGYCTEYLHLFLALDLEADPLEADDDEAIDLLFFSLEKTMEMIESGEICDAKTIAGILRYANWSAHTRS
jgi:ADP-ribose pyrophosphatase